MVIQQVLIFDIKHFSKNYPLLLWITQKFLEILLLKYILKKSSKPQHSIYFSILVMSFQIKFFCFVFLHTKNCFRKMQEHKHIHISMVMSTYCPNFLFAIHVVNVTTHTQQCVSSCQAHSSIRSSKHFEKKIFQKKNNNNTSIHVQKGQIERTLRTPLPWECEKRRVERVERREQNEIPLYF